MRPGQSVRVYEPGTALRVPAGATLIIQEHYTATGKETTDRTRIGIKWAKEAPKTDVDVATLQNMNFVLPAGSSDTRVDAELTLKEDMTIWSVLPHTHMRGKKWEVTAIYPDGRSEMILNVPKYDFNWQTDYVFKTAAAACRRARRSTRRRGTTTRPRTRRTPIRRKTCIGATRPGKRCSSRRSPSA